MFQVGSVILIAPAMIFSQARGPMIALMAGTVVLLLSYRIRLTRSLLLLFAFLILIFVALANGYTVAGVSPSRYLDLVSLWASGNGIQQDPSIGERATLVHAALAILAQDPMIWIVGLGYPNLSGANGIGFYSHNLTLDVLMELGVFGLALYVLIVLLTLRRAITVIQKSSGYIRGYSVLFTAMLVFMLVISNTSGSLEGLPMLWLVILLIGNVYQAERKARLAPNVLSSGE